jgi:hypothetical protein
MNSKRIRILPALLPVFLWGAGILAPLAAAPRDQAGGTAASGMAAEAIPLRRIVLFSSGVGYFEHEGGLSGPAELNFPFRLEAVNDALKSLVVRDSASAPQMSYPSGETLYRTLRSLSIDLSGQPGVAEIMENLRGAEIEIRTREAAVGTVTGRILGIERQVSDEYAGGRFPAPRTNTILSLSTAEGIKIIPLADVGSFVFTDPGIRSDLDRALDLILASGREETQNLRLSLPGDGGRTVSVSYVIPAPVWKVSYRLDLNQEAPLFQGWAIVDNDGDTDWTGVELTLVSGRPVSFIQNLYAPYRLRRPTLPLAIAGTTEARTYDSSFAGNDAARVESPSMEAADDTMKYSLQKAAARAPAQSAAAPVPAPVVMGSAGGGNYGSAGTGQDQFQFTLGKPVTLERRQSAMLPLIDGTIQAEKTIVFSGNRAANGAIIHPALSVELTNTIGMKLPAGPVTVFDGGTYGGDALLEFLNEGEKRLISYGDDLAVTGSMTANSVRRISGVSISRGVMTITRKIGYEKTYTLRNAAAEGKKLVLEHAITPGTELIEPAIFDERTGSLYRFRRDLPGNSETAVTVREESPLSEQVVLSQARDEVILGYVSNTELSQAVREKLRGAIELKRAADTAGEAVEEAQYERARLGEEQDRIRKNLEAAGSESPQGQEYLKRLSALDDSIDAANLRAGEARQEAREARLAYESYLTELTL